MGVERRNRGSVGGGLGRGKRRKRAEDLEVLREEGAMG